MSALFEHIRWKLKNTYPLEMSEAEDLMRKSSLADLAGLAGIPRRRTNSNKVCYNRNVHIEPTNICKNHCLFCAYRASKGQAYAWEYSIKEISDKAKAALDRGVTEIHIVGGVHPDWDIYYYAKILQGIRKLSSTVHLKAFTAEEIRQMCDNAGLSIGQGLKLLIDAGLNSVPGGGAEIFAANVRQKICPDKIDANGWLDVHRAIHNAGLKSNATMLYGHIESIADRIDHMNRLRDLQDETGGFNAFIPLKFKSGNNKMSEVQEARVIDDMRTYAVSRMFLHNIPHIKAYWPMNGKDHASLSLAFGVDDLDGTIDDSTRIYSMAGSEEKKPQMHVEDIRHLIEAAGYKAVERDSLYRELS